MADAGGRTLYTVGHSTRTITQFTDLLTGPPIELVVDVRAFPRSRTNPQFNIDVLPASLAAQGVDYRHVAELGGRRHRARDAPPSPNLFWRNDSFRNYADYAMSDEFARAMQQLRGLAQARTCAIMCSEALWWRCHRRIIADYALAAGIPVQHILGPEAIEPARLTPGVQAEANGTLVYPA